MRSPKEPASPLEKRELLHKDEPDKAKIDVIARAMIQDGRAPEAIEYIEVTSNPELIAMVQEDALKRGSAFLLQAAERLGDQPADPALWKQLGDTAFKAERYLDAVRAYACMGDEELAEQIRATHCPDYEPFKPLGK
jgi:hypothetical protein